MSVRIPRVLDGQNGRAETSGLPAQPPPSGRSNQRVNALRGVQPNGFPHGHTSKLPSGAA
ncbi:MAG: hypothetical protein AB7H80_06635 [Candidatus Kapaibacterium sp.]